MPKNPLVGNNEGFRAMEKRLAGAKKMKPMKPSKPRPNASSSMVKAVNPGMTGNMKGTP